MCGIYITNRSEEESESMGVGRLLKQLFGCPVSVAHRPSGAPYLVDYPEWQLSISHSKHIIAVALSRQGEGRIGLDVEEKYVQAARLLERYASSEEQEILSQAGLPALVLWSAKEALYKAYSDVVTGFAEQIVLEECRVGVLICKVYLDAGGVERVLVRYRTSDIASGGLSPHVLAYVVGGMDTDAISAECPVTFFERLL